MINGLRLSALTLALAVLLTAGTAGAQETKLTPDAAELKRMSVFLSNFTEIGFWDIDSPAEMGREDLIRFGIMHNYVNNFKSRIVPRKDDHGDLTIDGRWVAESVKKYFDLELKHGSVLESDPPYYYDGRAYHFYGADGEAVYHARVREVYQLADGNFRMTGELYNADDNDAGPTFEAVVKPYRFNGKDTWALISLRTAAE